MGTNQHDCQFTKRDTQSKLFTRGLDMFTHAQSWEPGVYILSERLMTGAAQSTLCPVNRYRALWRATSAQICVKDLNTVHP